MVKLNLLQTWGLRVVGSIPTCLPLFDQVNCYLLLAVIGNFLLKSISNKIIYHHFIIKTMSTFIDISLRYQAIYIPQVDAQQPIESLSNHTAVFVANLKRLGFAVDEPLLRALNQSSPSFQAGLLNQLKKIVGTDKNWTPLVKAWHEPTGESMTDHLVTFFANIFKAPGTPLPCGHTIPGNTFPLERYNGCPFCGTPFEFGEIEVYGQGSKLKLLTLWQEAELTACFTDLLTSKTALDATQQESLKALLTELPLPAVEIGMKETVMTVIDALVDQGKTEQVQRFFKTPTDILRYLWFKKTGFLQIIEPKTIVERSKKNARAVYRFKSQETIAQEMDQAKLEAIANLKLKYTRKECLMVATWLTNLAMTPEQMCESMHPKRSMWVRFIRALRLAEYAKRKGFEKLQAMLHAFYHELYDVWQGRVNFFRLKYDADKTFTLLKQRPGLFARSLFTNMLWFGKEATVTAFAEVVDQVPARLLFTLSMYAPQYFTAYGQRSVKPLGGVRKHIPKNQLLQLYNKEQLKEMVAAVEDLCLLAMQKRFAAIETESKSIYIDPMLFNMPVAIGDRGETVQDLPSALMGAKFPVEGDVVRLFMQWGVGLPAQHLDMDLSCYVAYEDTSDFCSYSQLSITGCQHSGDIRSIPNQVGTAEYIDINIPELEKAGAKYVTFTCNAYSSGSLSPNLVVGWMSSEHPMHISTKTGVAYDPSCVQHQAKITRGLTKGLVFGLLDIENREITWLELPFHGQVVGDMNMDGVKALLDKLDAKLNIGNLLLIKADAQELELQETAEEADEVYDQKWAINAAAVTQLLID